MKKTPFFLILCLSNSCALAEITIDATCYSYAPVDQPQKDSAFVLQSYYDTTLQKEVGAFVRYVRFNKSNETIPLVFVKRIETDTDAPDLGNFELHRLEVVNDQVTGSYIFVQTGGGNRQYRYVEYTNFKTKKILRFNRLGSPKDCDSLYEQRPQANN